VNEPTALPWPGGPHLRPGEVSDGDLLARTATVIDPARTAHSVGLAGGDLTQVIDGSVTGMVAFGLTIEPSGGSAKPTLPTAATIPITDRHEDRPRPAHTTRPIEAALQYDLSPPPSFSGAVPAAAVPKAEDRTVLVLRRWSLATVPISLSAGAAMAAQRPIRRRSGDAEDGVLNWSSSRR
jgi:hypothetical protein